MTSNIGSELLLSNDPDVKQKVSELVKSRFKPEFLNRIDEQIIFNPLGLAVQIKIAEKLLIDLTTRLQEKNIELTFDESVEKFVIKHGFNDEYGARPLKRFIQRQIETFIATKMIEGDLVPHHAYDVFVENDELNLKEKGRE